MRYGNKDQRPKTKDPKRTCPQPSHTTVKDALQLIRWARSFVRVAVRG
jgi:hypothetical protein